MLNRHAVPVVSLTKTSGLRDALRKGRHVMARVAIITGRSRRIGRAISGDMRDARLLAMRMDVSYCLRTPA